MSWAQRYAEQGPKQTLGLCSSKTLVPYKYSVLRVSHVRIRSMYEYTAYYIVCTFFRMYSIEQYYTEYTVESSALFCSVLGCRRA